MEPTTAIPQGGEDKGHLQDLTQVPGGELPGVNPDASEALDQLLAAKTKEKADAAEGTPAPEPKPAPAPKPDPAAPAPKPDATPAPVPDPAAPATPPAVETYESVEPPPNVKPKTAESFAKVKTLAKAAITAAEEKAAAAEKRALELEEKSKNAKALTPETEKELEELRKFRTSLDVEADPQFKQFDAKIAANEEAILSRLKTAGASDEVIAKIKEIGISDVNWDELTQKMPAQVRRLIDSKLVDNENLADQKKQAINAAKANADEFLKTRSQAQENQAKERQDKTRQEIDKHLPQMTWLALKPIPTDAKPEERAGLEAHNKLVTDTKADLDSALNEDTPEMRAALLLSYAQLRRVREDIKVVQSDATAKEKALQDQITALTKERDEANAFVKRVKGASTARIHSSAPPSDAPAAPKVDHTTDPSSALDAARDAVLAAKAARAE